MLIFETIFFFTVTFIFPSCNWVMETAEGAVMRNGKNTCDVIAGKNKGSNDAKKKLNKKRAFVLIYIQI